MTVSTMNNDESLEVVIRFNEHHQALMLKLAGDFLAQAS